MTEDLFILFPNPGNGEFIVKSDKIIDNIAVFNIRGEQLGVMPINALSKQIDISHLDAGVYFVKASTGNQSSVKRIVIF